MSLRFNASGDRLQRTANVLDYNSTYTYMGWYYMVTDRNAFNGLFFLGKNDAGVTTEKDALYLNATGTTFRMYCGTSAGGAGVNGGEMPLTTWTHVAVVRESATSCKVYVNGALDITNTQDMTGRAAVAKMLVSGEYSSGGYSADYLFDGRVAAMKAWTRALTIDEIKAEMNAIRPLDPTSLYGFWPGFPGDPERFTDYSGNGYSWTENGTVDDEDPPYVSYGSAVFVLPYAAAGDYTVSKSEGVTLGENQSIQIADALAVSVTDGVTVGDTGTGRLDDLKISQAEGVTIGDTGTGRLGDLEINKSEGLTLGESSSVEFEALAAFEINVSDGVTLGEAANADLTIVISQSDGVTIGDTGTGRLGDLETTISEGMTVGEAATVQVQVEGELYVSVSDGVTAGDTVTLGMGDMGIAIDPAYLIYWTAGVEVV